MKMARVWAMPTKNTFDCLPIGNLVRQYLAQSSRSIDPFARNKKWATYTNDLDTNTLAEYHLDAVDFLKLLIDKDIKADLLIFDPPYSPRQIKECYNSIGLIMKYEDAHLSHSWKLQRDLANQLLVPNSIVINCGWNSLGMGKARGYEIIEILLVCHGAGHNDTIITIERKRQSNMSLNNTSINFNR